MPKFLPPITVQALDETAGRAALSRTNIDIQMAGEKGYIRFYAAHNNRHSIAALIVEGGNLNGGDLITVWEILGGTKEERKAQVQRVRDKYIV